MVNNLKLTSKNNLHQLNQIRVQIQSPEAIACSLVPRRFPFLVKPLFKRGYFALILTGVCSFDLKNKVITWISLFAKPLAPNHIEPVVFVAFLRLPKQGNRHKFSLFIVHTIIYGYLKVESHQPRSGRRPQRDLKSSAESKSIFQLR